MSGDITHIESINTLKPQRRNANRHTPRGLGQLEKSIQQDGWIGAVTVAADGETFDGSARVELSAATGFDDAIVVETDGSKPVIVRRTDIPSANDPRAKRLGIAANRIPQVNLDFDPVVLADLDSEIDLSTFFTRDEREEIQELAALAADVDDQLDGAPASGHRDFGNVTQQIKVVLYFGTVGIFEQAIAATGMINRGEAITAISQQYLDTTQRVPDAEG